MLESRGQAGLLMESYHEDTRPMNEQRAHLQTVSISRQTEFRGHSGAGELQTPHLSLNTSSPL